MKGTAWEILMRELESAPRHNKLRISMLETLSRMTRNVFLILARKDHASFWTEWNEYQRTGKTINMEIKIL